MIEKDPIPKYLSSILDDTRDFLRSPFSHYSFSIQLSMDSQIDIAYRSLIRYYQKSIINMREEHQLQDMELAMLRNIAADFKKA